MNSKSLLNWLGVLVVLFAFLLTSNVITSMKSKDPTPFSRGNVRGVTVVREEVPYTLNFEQQDIILRYLNIGIKASDEAHKEPAQKLPISQIIIHRFNKKDTVLTPIDLKADNFTFKVSDNSFDGLLMEFSMGKFKNILIEATQNSQVSQN